MTAQRPLARSDVVLVLFPFTDLSSAKLRPALVVGHVVGMDMILAFITSQLGTTISPSICALAPADPEFARTGLKAPSAIHLDKLATLHRSLVRRRLGQIGAQTEQRVNASLRHALAL